MRLKFCSQRLPQEQIFLCRKFGFHEDIFAVAEIYISSQMKFGSHKENVIAERLFSLLNKFGSHGEFEVAGKYFVANILALS